MGFSNHIFGSIPKKEVVQKIKQRQALAQSADPMAPKTEGSEGPGLKFDDYTSNFNGVADLSSRTPFVRMWVALAVAEGKEEGTSGLSPSELKEDGTQSKLNADKNLYVRTDASGFSDIMEWVYAEPSLQVYQIGNHVLNTLERDPFESRKDAGKVPAGVMKELLPFEQETDLNKFMRPPAGITGVSSATEGPLGSIKKTTVNFVVHNFADFEKIYLQYFLRPGAQVFVDFGWDTAKLYDIEKTCKEAMGGASTTDGAPAPPAINIEEKLYGNGGVIQESKGDLEIIIGNVVSYDAQIREDGGFDCSIEIVSKNMALLSHELPDSFKGMMDDRLDIGIIAYATNAFDGTQAEHLGKAARGELSGQGVENFSANSDKDAMKFLYYKWASENLGGKDKSSSVPGYSKNPGSLNASKIGIYFGGAEDNNLQLYVCYGWIEDKILNKEFGFGETPSDLENSKGKEGDGFGHLHAKFDSSDSYVNYSKELHEAQKARTKEDGNVVFLYPENWDKELETYNWKRGMVPHFDDIDGDLYTKPTKTGYFENPDGTITENKKGDKIRGVCPLREIFISVKTLKDSIARSSTPSEIISNLFGSVKSDSEDIIDVVAFCNKTSAEITSLIDKNCVIHSYQPDQTPLEFFPHSPNTIVKEFNLSYSTPQGGLQDMMAIQSLGALNSPPNSVALDSMMAMNGLHSQKEGTGDETRNMYVKWLPSIGGEAGRRLQKELRGQNDAEIISFSDTSVAFGKEGAVDTPSTHTPGFKAIPEAKVEYGDLTDDEKKRVKASVPSSEGESAPIAIDFEELMSYAIGGKEDLKGKEKEQPAKYTARTTNSKEVINAKGEKETITYDSVIKVKSVTDFHKKRAGMEYYASKSSAVLPIGVSLKIYGIASLHVGNLITVDYLPVKYQEQVFFQITKITHTIGDTWDTAIETVMRLKDPQKFKNDTDAYMNAIQSVELDIEKAVNKVPEEQSSAGMMMPSNELNCVGIDVFKGIFGVGTHRKDAWKTTPGPAATELLAKFSFIQEVLSIQHKGGSLELDPHCTPIKMPVDNPGEWKVHPLGCIDDTEDPDKTWGKCMNFEDPKNGSFKLEFQKWGIWPRPRGYYMKYELDMKKEGAYWMFIMKPYWVIVPQGNFNAEYLELDVLFARILDYMQYV